MRSFILFERFGINNCKIELVEEFSCKSKEQLSQREGFYIKNVDCINRNIPLQTRNEYYKRNKTKLDNYTQIYREMHKEQVNENKNKEVICECGCLSTQRNIARHRNSHKHLTKLKSLQESAINI